MLSCPLMGNQGKKRYLLHILARIHILFTGDLLHHFYFAVNISPPLLLLSIRGEKPSAICFLRGIRFAQRILIVLICLCGAGYFRFQLLLFVLRIRQPLRVIVLPRIALLQLVAGLLKRALVLTDRILLKLKGALKRG